MTRSPYFDYGYAAHGQSQLALYEPVMGSFLLILDDLDVARHVKILTSSRYQLLICCLDPVIHGRTNLIDNACCEQWSIPDDQFDLGTIIKQLDPLVLTQILPQYSPDPQVYAEKSWLQMVWHWSKFMRSVKNRSDWYDFLSTSESFLPMLSSMENLDVSKFSILVNKLIYFGRDLVETDDRCRNCLAGFPFVESLYHQWMELRS